MSSQLLTRVIGTESCYFYSDGDGSDLGIGGRSHVVGVNRPGNGKNEWRVVRYPIAFDTTVGNVPITSLSIEKLEFTPPYKISEPANYYNGYYMKYTNSVGSNTTNEDYKVYGFISDQSDLSIKDLQAKTDSFFIVDLSSSSTSKQTITVSLSKEIKGTTDVAKTWYLYVFTKNTGGSYKTGLCWWGSGSAKITSNGTSEEIHSMVNVYGTVTTYTKLASPTTDISLSGVMTPNGKVDLDWIAVDDDNCAGYILSWECGSANGTINIAGRATNSYTYTASSLTRGKSLSFSMVAKHSADATYNSDPVSFPGSVKINSLPTFSSISFGNVTIPKQHPSGALHPTINFTDTDNQNLTYYYRIGGTGNFIEYSSDVGMSIQNGKQLEIYANDGLERSNIWSAKIEAGNALGITVNSPPAFKSFTVSYGWNDNAFAFNLDSTKAGTTLQLKINGNNGFSDYIPLSDPYILNIDRNLLEDYNIVTPLGNKVLFEGFLIDDYGDESNTLQTRFEPKFAVSESFLTNIQVNCGDESWPEDLEMIVVNGFSEVDFSINKNEILINNPNDLIPNSVYNFNIALYQEGINLWRINELKSRSKSFIKFLKAPEFSHDIVNPFEAWLDQNSSTFSCSVGVTEVLNREVFLILKNGTKEKVIPLGVEVSNNNTWVGSCQLRSLYEFYNGNSWDLGINQLSQMFDIQIFLKYNLEEEGVQTVIKSPTALLTFDFDYIFAPPDVNFVGLENNPIYEDFIPKIELQNFKIATQADINFILQVDRNDGKGFVTYDETLLSYNNFDSPNTKNGKLVLPEVTQTLEFKKVGEIADTKTRTWRLIAKLLYRYDYYQQSKNDFITQVIQHTEPTNFLLTNSTWRATEENALLTFSVNLNTNITDYIANSGHNYTVTYEVNTENGEVTVENDQLVFKPETEDGPYNITIKIITNIDGRTKEALSNAFIVYREGPTVSYRPHHIGINTTVIEEDGILTIVPGSDARTKIYLRNPHGGEIIVDLSLSQIFGVTIDGGTWDTPNEI